MRNTKYISIPKVVIAVVLIIEIITLVNSWVGIKEEDPLKEIKGDLLIIKALLYALAIMMILPWCI